MKSKTPELMKFKRLCRRLKESTRGVVGLLELLWRGTAQNCPEGDVGRLDNLDIAVMVDWPGDADELIEALVAERWLDEHPQHRLVVHDWPDHAPNWVRMNLRRAGRSFAATSADSPAEPTAVGSADEAADATAVATRESTPSPPTPSPITPPPPSPPASGDWAEVEAELRNVGVAKVRATLEAAQSRGADPADVLHLVRDFTESPGAWGVGALVQMIAGDLDAWPPPAADYRPPADRELAAERKRLNAARDELEASWGDRYRQLPRDKQADLHAALSPLQRRLGRVQQELAAIELLAAGDQGAAA